MQDHRVSFHGFGATILELKSPAKESRNILRTFGLSKFCGGFLMTAAGVGFGGTIIGVK